MVHALKEAHRVLKPDGILIDLRPAPAHRKLGIGAGKTWRLVGPLDEILEDDYAADAAVARMVREGFLRREKFIRFRLDRVMDSMQDVREFMEDFNQRRDLPSDAHAALLERLERRLQRQARPEHITVRGPMHLAVLRKLPAATS